MKLSKDNKNTRETWETYFSEQWEANNGRMQTQLFAKYFLKTVRLPGFARSLLDVGCGMGDAVAEFHRRYPRICLTGCDVSDVALDKARASYGKVATFNRWSFEDIPDHFDVIYCSNVLEHFEHYLEIAETLLGRCRLLYVMVPFMELRQGRRLSVTPNEWHVATFDECSFNELVERGSAARIRYWTCDTPGAWGGLPAPLWRRIARWMRRQWNPDADPDGIFPPPSRQIIYELTSRENLSNA